MKIVNNVQVPFSFVCDTNTQDTTLSEDISCIYHYEKQFTFYMNLLQRFQNKNKQQNHNKYNLD